jgi:ubiquinone/menaquinone biosynthesis C-methylase UbiE
MLEMLPQQSRNPGVVVDIGCSTGLSTLFLSRSFPSARIIGVDLSSQMLAVAVHKLNTSPELEPAQGRVEYVHASGENTRLPSSSVDMVSLCLVNHELPTSAARYAAYSNAHWHVNVFA